MAKRKNMGKGTVVEPGDSEGAQGAVSTVRTEDDTPDELIREMEDIAAAERAKDGNAADNGGQQPSNGAGNGHTSDSEGAAAKPSVGQRLADARAARGADASRPRNPPVFLVLGQRREDDEYDMLAARKSKRGAEKFISETKGLIRRSYKGYTVFRAKIVGMEGF